MLNDANCFLLQECGKSRISAGKNRVFGGEDALENEVLWSAQIVIYNTTSQEASVRFAEFIKF
jgi:hypothetical protein